MWDVLKVYGPIALLVAAGFFAAYQFVDPAPPRQVTLATGSPEGAYSAFGKRYQEILAKSGIEVRLVPTNGSVENLALLTAGPDGAAAGVDLAFVQSGVGRPADQPGLESLASLYFEPLWVFARSPRPPHRLSELAGGRLAVGPEGSGTRDVALHLLAANGIADGDAAGSRILDLGGAAAAEALLAGELDAAFFVTAKSNRALEGLFAGPGIRLLSFERAEAYTRRYRFLSSVVLPEGIVDLAANLPAEDVVLLSPVATLVAREDMHPALIDLILRAASEIHGPGGIFAAPEQFPSPRHVDFPLSPEAERYFKSGIPFLRRVLPFWAATLVERLWVMILPILTLMIPLLRIAPPTYRWQVRRRIVRWYRDLGALEARLSAARKAADAAARDAGLADLERLQDEVGRIHVPVSYAEQLYNLRLHVEFVRRRFSGA